MNTGRFKNSISYYKNGQLQSKAKFKDNQLNGEYIRYHLGGALQQKKYFKNGVLEGPYRSYFSVGESMVEYEADYVDDKIVKKLIEYYSNGSIFKESTHRREAPTGKTVLYKRFSVGRKKLYQRNSGRSIQTLS